MLKENKNVSQIPGEGPRRWFFDEFFDLIVWYGSDGVISSFQLCYDKYHRERALTWKRGGAYQHHSVDPGEVAWGNKMTPILVADGVFDSGRVSKLFREKSTGIDPAVSETILDALAEYRAED